MLFRQAKQRMVFDIVIWIDARRGPASVRRKIYRILDVEP